MIYFLLAFFIIIGLWLILSGLMPKQREKRLLKRLSSPHVKKGLEERFIIPLAAKFARFIRLPDEKRERLEKNLKNNGYKMTPELYTARNLTVSALFLFVSVIMLLLHRQSATLLGIVFIVLAIIAYIRLDREVSVKAAKKRAAIQAELPQFMMTIVEALQFDRNITSTCDKYRLVAGPLFKKELDRLVLDMKTTNQEQALLSFADRIGIETLTSFITGLVSESRGVNQAEYLISVENGLRQEMKENLRKEALKKPDKMRIAQIMMIVAAMVIWLAALGYQIVYSLMYTINM